MWAQVLDRSQQRLELILIPESQFERSSLPKIGSTFESNGPANGEIAPIQVIQNKLEDMIVRMIFNIVVAGDHE